MAPSISPDPLPPEPAPPVPAAEAGLEARVLAVVRGLALEVGGARAERAATPHASLEREVGLGSLERVELLLRLEQAFGRSLDERFLTLDSAIDITRALAEAEPTPCAGQAGADEGAIRPSRAPAVAGAPAHLTTLGAALAHHAQREPERVHVWLPDEADASRRTLTYGRLLSDARAIAAALRARDVPRGARIALVLPTGADFLAVFQGVLLAGAVPVPLYPPVRLDRIEEYAQRQAAILRDAGVCLLVTFARALPVAALLRPHVPSLTAVVTALELLSQGLTLPATPLDAAALADASPDDAALIQYTSGSTGDPKGVLLTHAQLLSNVRAIARGVELRPDDVGVSWLPLYHDMGLIGAWLFALVHGMPLALLSPLAFLAHPERWLTTIHERRATLSAAPNFAYELCCRKVPEATLEGLDLSCWRAALNGAEPVNPDTLERFAARFARTGFRREALLPVYGLAENAVALAFPPVGRGPRVDRVRRQPFEGHGRIEVAEANDRSALRFVGVGRALPEHEIRLVDEAGRDVGERALGRLVFRGASTMRGYFGQPEATAAVTLTGGWIDSGDLAYRADDELYIAGRRKDLIIKAGRNLVPQEIEEAAGTVEGVRRGCIAAFGVTNETTGTEALVVVAETRESDHARREALIAAITERIADAIGLPPDAVVLAPPHTVPKTSSGKVRRARARELHLRGGFVRSRPRLGTRLRLALAAVGPALRPLRGVTRLAYAAYVVGVGLFILLAYWPPTLLTRSRGTARALAQRGSRMLLRLLGCPLSVEGLANLVGLQGPLVLASNHTSYLDIVALLALLPIELAFVAKREVLDYPFLRTFVRRGGHLAVERFEARESVADATRVTDALRGGQALVFFPEGTFTAATGLRPFRLGAFKAAVEARAPIVPLALSGARAVLRGNGLVPRPGRIHLWIGASLTPPAGDSFREIVDLRDRVAAVIAEHNGEPRLDLVAGGVPQD